MADKYEHRKALDRARQQKYYNAHKENILQKKRNDRGDLKRLRDEAAAAAIEAQPAPQPNGRVVIIGELCRATKRNMYAYDENNRVFDCVSEQSKNYCPIIFYKLHGHCYIVNDPAVIRSVAETNKKHGVNMITALLSDQVTLETRVPVYHLRRGTRTSTHGK